MGLEEVAELGQDCRTSLGSADTGAWLGPTPPPGEGVSHQMHRDHRTHTIASRARRGPGHVLVGPEPEAQMSRAWEEQEHPGVPCCPWDWFRCHSASCSPTTKGLSLHVGRAWPSEVKWDGQSRLVC